MYRSGSEFDDVTDMTPIKILRDRNETHYNDTGLLWSATYYYAITAVDHVGNENKSVSSVQGIVIDYTPPPPVRNLRYTIIEDVPAVVLKWNPAGQTRF